MRKLFGNELLYQHKHTRPTFPTIRHRHNNINLISVKKGNSVKFTTKPYLDTTAKVAPTVNPRLKALIHSKDMATTCR